MVYRNAEGYADPTAGAVMAKASKEDQEVRNANHDVIQAFRLIADLAGFEIVGRITLAHKKTGKIYK